MARKSTLYVVGERHVEGTGRDRRVRWTWIDRDANSIVRSPYSSATHSWAWTTDRKRATRFIGRTDAARFAASAVADMAAAGYPGVTLYVVPATGGVPVGAPILD